MKTIATILMALALSTPLFAQQGAVTVRVKDITSYRMAGKNQLLGEGLVVGLKGTGDKDDKKAQQLAEAVSGNASYFSKTLTAEDFASSNVARVIVTAAIDEGSTAAGSKVTATVSAVTEKTDSIEGGILISTPLRFQGSETVYADAFGQLVVSKPAGGGGGANSGSTTASVDARLVTDIHIPFYEEMVDENGVVSNKVMTLVLDNPDINTARDIAVKINSERESLGLSLTHNNGEQAKIARADGTGTVLIEIPRKWWGDETEFRYHIDNVSVNPDVAARVTINAVSGVIIVTGNVRVLPGSITAAGVTIDVGPNDELPKKLAAGEEATDPALPVNSSDQSFQELLDTLNLLNLSATEKAEVLKALQQAKLLQGGLEVNNN